MGEISAALTVMVIQTEAGGPMGGGNEVTSRIKDNFNVIKITHHNSIQIEFGNVKPKSTKYLTHSQSVKPWQRSCSHIPASVRGNLFNNKDESFS